MTGWEFGAVYLAWLVGGASPGPATLALASTGMARGRRAALALALGILLASAIWAAAAALGFSAAMLANAWLAEALKIAGAVYILWLAAKSLRSAMRPGVSTLGAAAPAEAGRAFFSGLTLHLANPKPILGWGAIYAVVTPPGAGFWDLASTGLILFTGSILVFVGYALLFSTEAAARRYAGARRWFEAVFGVLFGGAALAILTTRS